MMEAMKQMGVAYGRLGLSTDATVIEARTRGVKAASDSLKSADVPSLIKCAFGMKFDEPLSDFLSHFNDQDPTCALEPHDREVSLLAATVLSCEMERERKLSGPISLGVLSAAFGNLRKPITDIPLFFVADATLTKLQSKGASAPVDFEYTKQPEIFENSVNSIEGLANQPQANFSNPHIVTSFREIGEYAESTALASARNDNTILAYIRKLEEETRIQWWVMSGWNNETNQPYRAMPLFDAAIRAGRELAEKHAQPLGIYSGLALLDKVLTTGRQEEPGKLLLTDAAVVSDRSWRTKTFGPISNGPLASVFPVTTALGMSSTSDDAPDWKPRFQRITQLEPDFALSPLELSLQMYRETLAIRAFNS